MLGKGGMCPIQYWIALLKLFTDLSGFQCVPHPNVKLIPMPLVPYFNLFYLHIAIDDTTDSYVGMEHFLGWDSEEKVEYMCPTCVL